MANQIVVENGERRELAKIFKSSYATVCSALLRNDKTYLQSQIRKAAIERGGVEIIKKEQVVV